MEPIASAGPERLAAFQTPGPAPRSERDNPSEELAEATQIRRGKAPLPIEAGTVVDIEA